MKQRFHFNAGRKLPAHTVTGAFLATILCLATLSVATSAQDRDDKTDRDDDGGRLSALIRAEQPPAPCTPNETAVQDVTTVSRRGDVVNLPDSLKTRLFQLAARPHTYLPIHAFAEAVNANGSPKPSRLFQYYLIDTTGFQPNIFTTGPRAASPVLQRKSARQSETGGIALQLSPFPHAYQHTAPRTVVL